MVNSKKESILNVVFDSRIFRIAYIMDLYLDTVAFLENFSFIIRCFMLLWGGIILVNNFIMKKNIQKIKYFKLLLLFLISCFLTTFIHISDNFLPNLLAIYHTSVCFFLFYGMYVERDSRDIEKEMTLVFKIFIYTTAILSIIGLLIFYFAVQVHIGGYWLGIYRNRLQCVYTNCNFLALHSVISIICCHILICKNKVQGIESNIKKNNIYYICMSIDLICLILSDSNASLLFLVVYVIVYIFYKVFSFNGQVYINHVIKRSLALFFVALILAFSTFAFREFCQDGVAKIINSVHNVEEPTHDNEHTKDNTQIGRENYDISSGRITLWKQAYLMFKKNPIIGIGRGNIVEYGDRYLEGGLIFSEFHNGYITILVSWGIVGFTIFAAFSLCVSVNMAICLFKRPQEYTNDIFPNLFAFLVSYCIYSLFEKTILSEITYMVLIFWLVLGYAMSYVNKYSKSSNYSEIY